MSCVPAPPLFPDSVTLHNGTLTRTPSDVAVRSLPTVLTILFAAALAGASTRRAFTPPLRAAAAAVGVATAAAAGAVGWRTFGLLATCTTAEWAADWQYVATVSVPAVHLVLVLMAVRGAPRTAAGGALALASATAVADWGVPRTLDGGATGARLLVAAQQLWCLQATCALGLLPRSRHAAPRRASSTSATKTTVVYPVDSLARRPRKAEPDDDDYRTGDRVWSWFL